MLHATSHTGHGVHQEEQVQQIISQQQKHYINQNRQLKQEHQRLQNEYEKAKQKCKARINAKIQKNV